MAVFSSLLVVLLCLIGASVTAPTSGQFTARFKVVSGQWSQGYFEGTIFYDYNAKNFNLRFPLIGLYNELYRFNSKGGYTSTFTNGQFFSQYLYRTSSSCSCETGSLNYVMPPLFQTTVKYGTDSAAANPAWTAAGKVVVDGKTFIKYKPFGVVPDKNILITEYLETEDGTEVGGFTMSDGRTFTLSNYVAGTPDQSTFVPPTGCKCSKPIDVVLSLDRSGSISYREFLVERSFARNISNAFDFGPQKTNMALLNWNINRWTQIKLLDGTSLENYGAAVNAMACSSANPSLDSACTCCGTPIGAALWDAGREMLTSSRKATKVIIILTDGCQNHYFNRTTQIATPCGCPNEQTCASPNSKCAIDLEDQFSWVTQAIKDVKILVIGVGTDREICPLQLALVSGNKPENVWNPTSWDELSAFVESIAASACSVSENPCTEKCCGICSCGSCLKPLNCTPPNDCFEAYVDPATGCCATKPKICPTLPCKNVQCLDVGGCVYTERVCNPPNNCVNSTCNVNTNNCRNIDNGNCKVYPPECLNDTQCDDGRKCFVHTCYNNSGNMTCLHHPKNCTSNACVQSECNPTDGLCTAIYTNCDDGNTCTIDKCDNITGCSNTNVTCPVSEDKCDRTVCDPLTGCYFIRNTCSNYNSTNCTIWSCANGTCSNVSVCIVVPPTTGSEVALEAVVGGALGAAAIAGIVIAIVVAVAAAAGGGAAAYGAAGGAAPAAPVANNPLYAGSKPNTTNPIYKAQ